jgi:hypothetical protein
MKGQVNDMHNQDEKELNVKFNPEVHKSILRYAVWSAGKAVRPMIKEARDTVTLRLFGIGTDGLVACIRCTYDAADVRRAWKFGHEFQAEQKEATTNLVANALSPYFPGPPIMVFSWN